MQLTRITAADFDLKKTLESGQVFHWQTTDGGFVGVIDNIAIYVEQRGGVLLTSGPAGLVRHYFALDHPLAEICAAMPNDEAMNAARVFCRGLRIIRQPKWECLATFICSSMKQVAHIRQISEKLRERFGQPRKTDHHIVYTFPTAERIARTTEADLRSCSLGYRAQNLLATATLVARGKVDLDKAGRLSDDDLRASLCELPGVGAKVANCVMLFAYERLRAFPIDVWIERVLREKYFAGKDKVTTANLQDFAHAHFGEQGGYAQQYLFHHARMNKRTARTSEAGPEPDGPAAPKSAGKKRRPSLHDKNDGVT